jgi:hypothetical protein
MNTNTATSREAVRKAVCSDRIKALIHRRKLEADVRAALRRLEEFDRTGEVSQLQAGMHLVAIMNTCDTWETHARRLPIYCALVAMPPLNREGALAFIMEHGVDQREAARIFDRARKHGHTAGGRIVFDVKNSCWHGVAVSPISKPAAETVSPLGALEKALLNSPAVPGPAVHRVARRMTEIQTTVTQQTSSFAVLADRALGGCGVSKYSEFERERGQKAIDRFNAEQRTKELEEKEVEHVG